MSLYLLKIPLPFSFGAGSPKAGGRVTALQLPRKVSKFIFSSLSHLFFLYTWYLSFSFHSILILSFQVDCMSLSLSLSCGTHNPVSIRNKSPDWRLRYFSLSGGMEWVKEKRETEKTHKSTTSSQSIQWIRLQVCTGILPEDKNKKKEPKGDTRTGREERHTERNRVCDGLTTVLENSYNKLYL